MGLLWNFRARKAKNTKCSVRQKLNAVMMMMVVVMVVASAAASVAENCCYLRQVNGVNGRDTVFVLYVCVYVSVSVCSSVKC